MSLVYFPFALLADESSHIVTDNKHVGLRRLQEVEVVAKLAFYGKGSVGGLKGLSPKVPAF